MKKVLFCFLFSLLFLFRSVDASVLLMIEAEGVVDGFVGEADQFDDITMLNFTLL